MLTQIIANVLYVLIAAGMLFQIVTVVRHATRIARTRHAARVKARPAARPKMSVPCPRLRSPRRRDYRLALRAARASVSA